MASTIVNPIVKSKVVQGASSTCQSEQLSAVSECKEETIQQKAYLLWESSGKPEGDGVDFWLKAEAALAEEGAASFS